MYIQNDQCAETQLVDEEEVKPITMRLAEIVEIGRLAGLDRRWPGGHSEKKPSCHKKSITS
jgi:hypothetical protein